LKELDSDKEAYLGNPSGDGFILSSTSAGIRSWYDINSFASGYIPKSLLDAYSILYADTDDTPVALTVAADKIVGRASAGGIAAIDCTSFARSLLDDATAAAAATTLGLGTGNSPQFQGLTVLGSSGSGKLVIGADGNPYVIAAGTGLYAPIPLLVFRRARGTLGTPLSVLENYEIGTFEVGGYDGSAYTSGWNGGVGFSAFAAEDWSSSAHGARLQLMTTPIGATNYVAVITFQAGGNVCIGTTTDSASAILNVASTTKGALLPRMTTTQRDAISTPVEGMLVFNLTTHVLNYYNGSAWAAV
jgi:hypothetical protein